MYIFKFSAQLHNRCLARLQPLSQDSILYCMHLIASACHTEKNTTVLPHTVLRKKQEWRCSTTTTLMQKSTALPQSHS